MTDFFGLGFATLPLHFKSWTPLLPEVAAGPGLNIVPEIVQHAADEVAAGPGLNIVPEILPHAADEGVKYLQIQKQLLTYLGRKLFPR